MKLTGIVRSAEDITGLAGVANFEGKMSNDKCFDYTKDMNDLAGCRIELKGYVGPGAYDYTGKDFNWQKDWLKDIRQEVDWSKVPVDAKVRIKNCGSDNRRHFAKYENGKVYCWSDGKTWWSVQQIEMMYCEWLPEQVELVED